MAPSLHWLHLVTNSHQHLMTTEGECILASLRRSGAALTALLLAFCTVAALPHVAAAQIDLVKVALAGGAIESSSTDFRLRGTLGEAVVGRAGSASYGMGQGFWAGQFSLGTIGVPEVEPVSQAPSVNLLRANRPNPFRASTTFEYSVAEEADVTLGVFDVTGRKVATVLEARQAPGTFRVDWDGRGDSGRRVANGIYFYRLTVGDWTSTRQLVNLK
jgi:hypothetical protein